MRITIIPADRFIRCDADFAVLDDWPFNDSHIHAIQWDDTEGEIEHREKPPRNEYITDPSIVMPYVQALQDFLSSQST